MRSNRGKKIDVLKLTHEGVTVEVPLIMQKGEGGEISFFAEIKEYDIRGSNSDADKLRTWLAAKYRERLSVDWQPYLRICFGGSTTDLIKEDYEDSHLRQESDSELKLHVERLWIGADHAGNKLYCDNDGDISTYKQHIRKGMPATGKVSSDWWHSRDDGDGTAALIPDTPENQLAVRRIIEGMEILLERIRHMLSQEQIENTLGLVTSNMLLLAPAPEIEEIKEP